MEIGTLIDAACNAIASGTNLTLNLPPGAKWPPGFPHGELLSVTDQGQNRSFDPIKVLTHVQRFVLNELRAPTTPTP